MEPEPAPAAPAPPAPAPLALAADAALVRGLYEDEVARDFRREVHALYRARWLWRRVACYSEGTAQLLLAATSVLAFLAGFTSLPALAFAAGCASTLTLAVLRFGGYSDGESAERHRLLARHLAHAGLEPPPPLSEWQRPPGDGADP